MIPFPTFLSVVKGFLVRIGAVKVFFLAAHVVEALHIQAGKIRTLNGRPMVSVLEQDIPLHDLCAVLGVTSTHPAASETMEVVVTSHGGILSAFRVDGFLGDFDIVVKHFDPFLAAAKVFSTATILPDESIAFVFNLPELMSVARGVGPASERTVAPATPVEEPVGHRILLVEDSAITREMERSLLQSLGYAVWEAVDGSDAVRVLGEQEVDLVVADVDMPNMNGFELTRWIRGHATLHSLPVVIVSTRGSQQDRQQGLDAGADAYVTKSEFSRETLERAIRRLIV